VSAGCLHADVHTSDARGWTTCLDPDACEPSSHGRCEYVETCLACGATRTVAFGPRRGEATRWVRLAERRASAALVMGALCAHQPVPGVTVRPYDLRDDGAVTVSIDGEERTYALDYLRTAPSAEWSRVEAAGWRAIRDHAEAVVAAVRRLYALRDGQWQRALTDGG